MLPAPLAPLDRHKTRALTTIYGPRITRRPRKNKTAQVRSMLEELPIKPSLSPFHPLPAIGQRRSLDEETKLFVLDLNKNDTFRPATVEERPGIKLHDMLKPLTPLSIHTFENSRCKSLEPLDSLEKKPQQLVRENTYDVIKPIFLIAPKMKKRDSSLTRRTLSPMVMNSENIVRKRPSEVAKVSARTRFKKAALDVAKLSSVPETGKLLCLREKERLTFPRNDDEDYYNNNESPESPTQKLNKLSEIFQHLEIKGHQREAVKKENSWF